MKTMYKMIIATTILTGSCLAAHEYKGTPLPEDLFDSTVDCGLNLDQVNKCVKEDREAGKGESFCNDVLLYAGNKQKMKDADAAMKTSPKTAEMQIQLIKGLNELQKKYTNAFMEAGLKPEEIAQIPPVKRENMQAFKCKKVPERAKKVHFAEPAK